MNEITPYEQLIAEKLHQVPVPDMADGIWSSIEMQLDAPADVPDGSDGSGAPDVPNAPAQGPVSIFKGIGWYGLAGIVAVVVLLWWYFGHKAPEKHERPSVVPPAVERPSVVPAPVESPPAPVEDSHTTDKPGKKKIVPVAPDEVKKDTVLFRGVPKDSVRVDSGARQNLLPAKTDSSSLQKNRIPISDDDPGYAPLPVRPKKPKGVKGITSDDYKISAGKDSLKKKN